MKIEPILFENINTTHTSFKVDFHLDANITFIKGDSGVGKSAVFSFLEEMATEDSRIKCFNYLDVKKKYRTSIRNFKEKLLVIDNADLLLDDKMREYIASDVKNQYIIIGRNPKGLNLSYCDTYELKSCTVGEITVFSLQKSQL